MDKLYAPQDIERRTYERWEQHGWFAPRGPGRGYCIVIPPPNVTGTLHMGHAFQHTLMDTLIRHRRMSGVATLWQSGTDHAGIATQMVVERQLEARGQRRSELSREQFVERVWEWKEQSGGTIHAQMRRLGDSVDWARDRFTMDPGLSRAVVEAFVRLHGEGLIYRGKRLVNWDPVLLTAVSDLEVEGEEEDGHLWHLNYPLEDGSGHLIVATTRPETLLGDTAVAVNPADERYRHLIGKNVRLPLTQRSIPVIADDYVDAAFGSGCVKITPAHDFNDYEIGKRHNLAQINIFTPDAKLNANAPARFVGLDRYEARRRILDELTQAGLVARIDKHRHIVPRGDRSGAVLEPYLTDQWYVKVEPLAREAIAAVRDGRTRFVPENWSRTYFEWMKNIHDWCISRQLWWGHRIPAWYDAAGNVFVGHDEADVRARHGIDAGVALTQDSDVLDTWFSSALWPFSTLGWPDSEADLARFYPTNVLVTAFDIIFFWVARMMMMGLKFVGEVPFRDVYITGLILDEFGEKMSKSKGNVLDPLDIVDGIDLAALLAKRTSGLMQPQMRAAIEKNTRKQFPEGIAPHGTDALRFTLTALATPTREIRFDLARVEGYRKFCNKLWNAARYVMLMVEPPAAAAAPEPATADRWIRSRFGRLILEVEAAFKEYRFDFAANALYQFTWYEFCDWYLELTKPVLQSPEASPGARSAARGTLLDILEALQRALHPLMPFITEEIWQKVAPLAGRAGPSVMVAPYPLAGDYPLDEPAEQDIAWVQQFVLAVRQIRGEMNIAPSRRIPVLLRGATDADWERVVRNRPSLLHLAGLEGIGRLAAGQQAPASATALLGEVSILVPMAGLIDAAAETDRLTKRLAKASQDLAKTRAKLASDTFVRNAPEAVVKAERERETEQLRLVDGLQAQIDRMRGLGD
ncbi:MAG TPA: valine--tRNA ligase [Steroidobacteraceae bacterium]|nr:valine--tRNA ligase [Steroidobacteraceae bacterium]